MPLIPLPLRVLSLSWGMVELLALLFTTGAAIAPAFAMYIALPPIALIIAGIIPAKWTASIWVRFALALLLVAAIVRRAHSIGNELLDNPPYLLAAGLQAISLVILAWIMFRVVRMLRLRLS
jgi:hypothetical protein